MTREIKTRLTREQYVVVGSIVSAVLAADALFSADVGESERCNDPAYRSAIAAALREKVSAGQLENLSAVLGWTAKAAAARPSGWDDDPEYPRADWQAEVANNDTCLGYREWVAHQREMDDS